MTTEANLPSWFDNHRQQNNNHSARQERGYAKRTGGKVQRGSGSSWRAKGDVKSEDTLTEMKFTKQKSFSITTTIINKILKAAAQCGREPELIIDFESIGVRAVVKFEETP